MCPVQQQQKFTTYNWHSNMPYWLGTTHALHSFCTQERPYLPFSVATKLQPPTTWLLQHIDTLYTLPTPLPSTTLHCTRITNTWHTYDSWQNGTRCRDGVKVLLVSFPSGLVGFWWSIPTCTCFHSENFFVTYILLQLTFILFRVWYCGAITDSSCSQCS